MARQLVFDIRFRNDSGIGQQVDTDLRVLIFEEGEAEPTLTRYLGTDVNSSIVRTADGEGVLYSTVVDATNLAKGEVTAKWYAKQAGTPVEPSPYVESLSNIFADGGLTVGDIKTYVRSMLGYPQSAVEISGGQFTAIIEEALTLYSQHIPAERVKRLNYQPSIQVYHLPEIPYNGPFDVKFVRKVVTPIASDPIFGREYLRTNQPDMGTMIIGTAYLEAMQRVLSSEPDWRWLHETKELYVNIGPGISSQVYGGYDVSVRYFVPVTLSAIREDHHRWFKRYCLAQAKKILSQIRGKFSGAVPAPGGALRLNHAELAEEGNREEEMLVQELRDMAPHVPPIFG